jgi:hypothetical protein
MGSFEAKVAPGSDPLTLLHEGGSLSVSRASQSPGPGGNPGNPNARPRVRTRAHARPTDGARRPRALTKFANEAMPPRKEDSPGPGLC